MNVKAKAFLGNIIDLTTFCNEGYRYNISNSKKEK